jgi:hypothetical protein
MPVTINGIPLASRVKPIPGRSSYNARIAKFAPLIAEARENGHHSIEEIAQYLNGKKNLAPTGRPFSYTTMQRIIHRLCDMGLADPPRTVSQALWARPSTPRPSLESRRESMRRTDATLARLLRENPELMKELNMPGTKPRK